MAAAPTEQTALDPLHDPISAFDRARVMTYFGPTPPDVPRYMIYVGGPLLVALTVGTFYGLPRTLVAGSALLGVLAFAVGAVVAWHARHRATDADLDFIIASDVERAVRLARDRAQLSASDLRYQDGCAYRNQRIERDYPGAFVRQKKCADEKLRWTPLDITVVHFGHQQLFVYCCAIDLTTGHPLHEVTREIFYPDIVSVVTQQDRDLKLVSTDKKSRKLVKYWSKRGAPIVNGMVHRDGPRRVTLQLANGEPLELASLEGLRNGMQPDETKDHVEATSRLRARLREAKQRTAPVARLPRIVRHSRPEG